MVGKIDYILFNALAMGPRGYANIGYAGTLVKGVRTEGLAP